MLKADRAPTYRRSRRRGIRLSPKVGHSEQACLIITEWAACNIGEFNNLEIYRLACERFNDRNSPRLGAYIVLHEYSMFLARKTQTNAVENNQIRN